MVNFNKQVKSNADGIVPSSTHKAQMFLMGEVMLVVCRVPEKSMQLGK